MIWPFRRRKTPQPSPAAIESIDQGRRELAEAKALRAESVRVGGDLRRSHEQNHFAISLAAVISGRTSA